MRRKVVAGNWKMNTLLCILKYNFRYSIIKDKKTIP